MAAVFLLRAFMSFWTVVGRCCGLPLVAMGGLLLLWSTGSRCGGFQLLQLMGSTVWAQ